ncbi:zinc-binding dehydrogenase [Parahaliea sp. F7430]|uniref:Zinc-binding dehydrogenase n=1 Tax=Sediminihaliea albiluteola TaxID=2758564 RepID=A0A7W2TWH5_9GAMM|nr:zinc-binding dehydrogenase [Sediminihaliea albiluteola]MBA6413228.1 zinc-binding dehydrogenase [Sediminihaliea albiluteola]
MSTISLARIHAPNDIRLDRVEMPKPGPNDLLVKVQVCGICGSDLSYLKLGGIPGATSPMPIGHEFSGEIAAAGSHVSGFSIGDRVAINPEGANNAIGGGSKHGAFSPYVLIENVSSDPGLVIKLPDTLDFKLAALIEPLAVGLNGIDRSALQAGEKVVVFGAGPVGLGCALLAKHFQAADVVVVDLSEKRLAVAKELGLKPFLASSGSISDFLKEQHGSRSLDPRLGEQPATDIYIEATGVGDVFQTILNTARKNARIVVIGVHFAPVQLDMLNFLMRQLTISSSMAYSNDTFARVCALLESGAIDPKPLITHQFALSEFDAAFAQASKQNEAIKVLVDCQQ